MAAKKLKSVKRPNLQKMSDDITTTTMLPGMEKAKLSMSEFEKHNTIIQPHQWIPELPLSKTTVDFGPMLDFAGVMCMILGLLCMGFAIGMMR